MFAKVLVQTDNASLEYKRTDNASSTLKPPLAAFENVGIYCDSIVSVPPTDWLSLSEWLRVPINLLK